MQRNSINYPKPPQHAAQLPMGSLLLAGYEAQPHAQGSGGCFQFPARGIPARLGTEQHSESQGSPTGHMGPGGATRGSLAAGLGTPLPLAMCQGDPQNVAHWEEKLPKLPAGKSPTQGRRCRAAENCFLLAAFIAMPQKPNNSKFLLAVQQSTT